MKRNREARVLPLDDDPDRFHAVLYVDGLRSDWSCGHRHIHADGAQPCVAALIADADSYLNGPEFREQSLGVAGAGLYSGPVEVLRHMEWRTRSGCRERRRVFVLGSERALTSYLQQRALGGRLVLPPPPRSPRGDSPDRDRLERGSERPLSAETVPGDQPEVL